MFNLRFKSSVLVFLIRNIVVTLFLIGFSQQAFAGNAYDVPPLSNPAGATGWKYIDIYNDLLPNIQNARVGKEISSGPVTTADYDSSTDTITVKTTSNHSGQIWNYEYSLTGPLGNITYSWSIDGQTVVSQFFDRKEDNSFSYHSVESTNPYAHPYPPHHHWVDVDEYGNITKERYS